MMMLVRDTLCRLIDTNGLPIGEQGTGQGKRGLELLESTESRGRAQYYGYEMRI
jgi:hypothetical protein